MQKATAYQMVADLKGVTINKLESLLSVANGTIRKAIERKSKVSTTLAEKIVSIYPEISLNWLLTGVGQMVAHVPDDTHTKTSDIKPDDSWKDKYIQALEDQKGLASEIGVKAAKAAIEQMASEYARKDAVEALAVSLSELRKESERNLGLIQVTQCFVTKRFAALEKVDVLVVADAFDNELLGPSTPQKSGKNAGAHK